TVRGMAGNVMLEVLDESGRLVHSRSEQVLTLEHSFGLNLSSLAPGTWFLRLTAGGHYKVLRLVVVA
ncbi:MAG: T9SS type A sorting domain-containing protein, partial [Bacteroidota bacterium]